MNRRPTLLAAAALTAVAALSLSACGSGDDSSSDDIKGADVGGGTASASPSVSASQGGVRRPEITLPSEFQADFENWANSDPKLQAVMDDGREQLRAKYAAVIDADPNSDAVAFYSSEATQVSARKWIKQFTDDDDSIIGKVTVFEPKALISDTGSGVLFYCVDERQASTKNRKTGKIVKTPDEPESVLQYRTRLDKTAQGVWKTTSVTVAKGGCSR
ncbi:hypothetical protein [Streptomyces sp. P17]|uniref:hypothetical protein n=1 Tax=Streptomyces sp. P17 TaxID=3074716 RepID=UPI0028F3F961|nr:hypothetical protein [Streptomyces sp. P17]MDT9701327.1 hypothetical protein [Streptomyces sp. P17]